MYVGAMNRRVMTELLLPCCSHLQVPGVVCILLTGINRERGLRIHKLHSNTETKVIGLQADKMYKHKEQLIYHLQELTALTVTSRDLGSDRHSSGRQFACAARHYWPARV